jgi:NAD(P)-dependent dehydrogenase (short-subunit alcohol dehydrogenase family)
MTKDQIIARIFELVPPGSPDPQDESVLAELRTLAASLVDLAKVSGKIIDPFQAIYDRQISTPTSELQAMIAGQVVLVTGGEGHIGQELISELQKYQPKTIVSVDNMHENFYPRPIASPDRSIVHKYTVDIRDREALEKIFHAESPEIVFHCAAQRLPAHGETDPAYTVSTNVFGTQNILDLCVDHKVQRCVFASTGKGSRFMTRDVYAGSKKVAEWMVVSAAHRSDVAFSIVRFTHVAQTSPVSHDMDNKLAAGMMGIHSPNSVIFAQSISEAVQLLLNGLALTRPTNPRVLSVASLGWPIEVLDLALHKMYRDSKIVPLFFRGYPDGYSDPLFRGQLAWEGLAVGNPLFNSLEPIRKQDGISDDIMVGAIAAFDEKKFAQGMSHLESIVQAAMSSGEVSGIKPALGHLIRETAQSAFNLVTPSHLLNILERGIDPRALLVERMPLAAHQEISEMLVKALYQRLDDACFQDAKWTHVRYVNLVESLRIFTDVQVETQYLIQSLRSFQSPTLCERVPALAA